MINDSNSSCPHSLSDHQKRSILFIYGLLGLASVIICLIGIIMLALLKLYRKFVYRLGMYQVIASGFFGFTRTFQFVGLLAIGEETKQSSTLETFCKTAAYITVLSSWIKLFLTVWLTVHLFAYTVCLKNLRKLELLYLASSVLFPPLIAAIPFITDSYGKAEAWCWITKGGAEHQCTNEKIYAGEIEQFAVWYGPALIVLLINSSLAIVIMSVVAFRIRSKLRGRNQETMILLQPAKNRNEQAFALLIPLLAYPLIFCILIIIPLVNRLYETVTHKRNLHLLIASAVSIPSMGICAGFAMILHIFCVKFCEMNITLSLQLHNPVSQARHRTGSEPSFSRLAYSSYTD